MHNLDFPAGECWRIILSLSSNRARVVGYAKGTLAAQGAKQAMQAREGQGTTSGEEAGGE